MIGCIELFMLTQQKGVDFTGKDLKGRELGVGICQRKDGLYTARFVSKRTGKSVQRYFQSYKSAVIGTQTLGSRMNMVESMLVVI